MALWTDEEMEENFRQIDQNQKEIDALLGRQANSLTQLHFLAQTLSSQLSDLKGQISIVENTLAEIQKLV